MVIDISHVRNLPLFRHMEPAALTRLMARATPQRFPQGAIVFEQGAEAVAFYVLLHGRLKVSQVTADGQQVMVRVVHPGDLFGFARALTRNDYPGTAKAAMDSLVISWPMTDWDAVVEGHPRLAMNAMQAIGQRLDEAHTRLREMTTEDAGRRIAHLLLRLARHAGPGPDPVEIPFPITRQDIADMSGNTLHTASRIMAAWEAEGILLRARRKVIIADTAGLAAIAETRD